jgi:hypothetical protein
VAALSSQSKPVELLTALRSKLSDESYVSLPGKFGLGICIMGRYVQNGKCYVQGELDVAFWVMSEEDFEDE